MFNYLDSDDVVTRKTFRSARSVLLRGDYEQNVVRALVRGVCGECVGWFDAWVEEVMLSVVSHFHCLLLSIWLG